MADTNQDELISVLREIRDELRKRNDKSATEWEESRQWAIEGREEWRKDRRSWKLSLAFIVVCCFILATFAHIVGHESAMMFWRNAGR